MYFPSLSDGFSDSADGKSTSENNEEIQQETINKEKENGNSRKTIKSKYKQNKEQNKCSKEFNDNAKKCKRLKKNRRGVRRSVGINHMKPQPVSHMKLFSTNGAGVKFGKLKSLNAEVMNTQSNIVTIQETHYSQKGKIQMNASFVVFEAIRQKKCGGTLIAIHKDLNPKLVEEHNDEFKLLVVEIETEEIPIRIMSGCGPQENWDEVKRISFFISLEIDIEIAELAGKSFIIQMDANSKLGSNYIKNYPHEILPNGVLLAAIIERHNLILGNGSDKCTGVITRRRVTR